MEVQVGPAFTADFFSGADGHDNSASVSVKRGAGEAVAHALTGLRLAAELPGHAIQVGVLGGGPAFTPTVAFQENQISSGAQSLVRVAETLLAIQRHTVERVALPAGRDLTDENVTELLKVAALLEGGRMRGRFDRIALAGETGG